MKKFTPRLPLIFILDLRREIVRFDKLYRSENRDENSNEEEEEEDD